MSLRSISHAVCACLLAFAAACNHDGLGQSSDGGVDGSSGAACSSLTDEASCRARTDCVADTCAECSCTPTFVACRKPTAAPSACPALGCATPLCCHTTQDCSVGGGFAVCQVPPINTGCGACFNGPGTCQTDADCAGASSPQICEPTPCACPNSPASKSCVLGCTGDSVCAETARCGTDGRCHDRPCDAGCTGNYTCDPSGARCVRKPCGKDTDCGVPGFCIEGACSKSVGQCIQPAA